MKSTTATSNASEDSDSVESVTPREASPDFTSPAESVKTKKRAAKVRVILQKWFCECKTF